EPKQIKTQAVQSASESAEMILRIDDVIAAQGFDADGGDAGGDGAGGDGGDGADSGGQTDTPNSGGPGSEKVLLSQQRYIIRTGNVDLRVNDFDSTTEEITSTVESYGGFVSDTQEDLHTRGNQTWKTGRLVLRVPSENFTDLLQFVKNQGTVLASETNAKDVTDRVVDLEARLKNLKAQRDRLRQLFERANETEDILKIEERLSEVQGEIERTEAQLRSLKQQVAFSTLTVDISETQPEITRVRFRISNLERIDTFSPGKTVRVQAMITNEGEATGAQKVEYKFNGDLMASKNVTLDPRESKTITFSFMIPANITEGNYPHSVSTEDDRASRAVTVREQEQEKAWYDVGIISAFLSSVSGVITTIRAVVVALAYLFPYMVVFGSPFVAVGYLWRRRNSRGSAEGTESEEGD
ncbi:MAG: DUF4349 domain-containing protein, partial [Halobacteria archaeon]|nr:DUF4349 domain-containing protein [Halobacteria archaeon]